MITYHVIFPDCSVSGEFSDKTEFKNFVRECRLEFGNKVGMELSDRNGPQPETQTKSIRSLFRDGFKYGK